MTRTGPFRPSSLALVFAFVAGCSSGSPSDNTISDPEGGSGNRPANSGGRSSGGWVGTTGTGASQAAGGSPAAGGAVSVFSCNGQFGGLAECGTVAAEASVIPPSILLLVDKSGSMSYVGVNSSLTKWQAIVESLAGALNELAPYGSFGLTLFPARDVALDSSQKCDDSCCRVADQPDVPVAPGATSVPQILEILNNQTGPGGMTPAARALALANRYFGTLPTSGGKRLVFLITDGGPNCSASITSCGGDTCTTNLDHQNEPAYDTAHINWCDDPALRDGPRYCLDEADTLAEITALRAVGVNTVVIGIPGSEPYADRLDAFAREGGQANPDGTTAYYRVADNRPDQLTQVFVHVATELITSCDIRLAEPPGDVDLVNIAVECQVVNKTDAAGAPAWTIDTASSPARLQLLGDLCTRAETGGLGRVDVLLGCPTVG